MTHEEAVNRALVTVARCGGRAWRQAVGTFFSVRGHVYRFGIPGMPDIGGFTATGRALQIEVKTGSGRARPDQRRWGELIKEAGGVYILARYDAKHDGDDTIQSVLTAS